MIDPNAAPLGFARYSAYQTVPLSRFTNIEILPSTVMQGLFCNGGPLLPEWEDQYELREAQGGVPLDLTPPMAPDDLLFIDEAMLWGGVINRSLSRLVAETTTRVLPAMAARPDDRIVFTLWPDGMEEDAPPMFWEIMAWLGVPEDRVLIVDQPIRVRELWVAPQGEQPNAPGPSYALLELLAANSAARGLEPNPADLLFVTRSNPGQGGLGHWLGERYLAATLKALGVAVMDPADRPIAERLAGYAGARTLICAEGDAAVTRQLLGYYDQDLVILARTPGARLGLSALAPRCQTLTYAEVTQDVIAMLRTDGAPYVLYAQGAFDEINLFRIFQAYGVSLQAAWDPAAYATAMREDVKIWMKVHAKMQEAGRASVDWKGTARVLAPVLEGLGVDIASDPDLLAYFPQLQGAT